MKTKKKLQLLISYEEKAELKEKHLRKLIKFSKDKDSLVRSSAASILINFENKAAQLICWNCLPKMRTGNSSKRVWRRGWSMKRQLR